MIHFVCVCWKRFKTFPCASLEVKNEPILGFKDGSPEREELLKVCRRGRSCRKKCTRR